MKWRVGFYHGYVENIAKELRTFCKEVNPGNSHYWEYEGGLDAFLELMDRPIKSLDCSIAIFPQRKHIWVTDKPHFNQC